MAEKSRQGSPYWWRNKKYELLSFCLGGGILGAAAGVFLFSTFHCLQLQTNATKGFYFSVLVGIPGIIWGALKAMLSKADYRKATASYIGFLIFTIPMLAGAVLTTNIPDPQQCDSLLGQLNRLVELEGQAVLTEDMDLIAQVYDPDAQIINQAGKLSWDTPYGYYSHKFDVEHHCEVGHANFTVTSRDTTQIIITTSSFGSWGHGEGTTCSEHYVNPPGSDEWTFRRDSQGNWRIVKFVFNRY